MLTHYSLKVVSFCLLLKRLSSFLTNSVVPAQTDPTSDCEVWEGGTADSPGAVCCSPSNTYIS